MIRRSIFILILPRRTRYAGAFVALLVFGILAVLQASGVVQQLDEVVLRALRDRDASKPIAAEWLLPLLQTITWFGDFPALLYIASAAAGTMLLLNYRREAVALLCSSLSGVVLMLLLKTVFGRPRPDVVPALAEVSSLSFPSGHALMSVAVYVPIALTLIRYQPRITPLLSTLLVLFILLISFSRMYLGVHYPSDIIAGWAIGTVCVLLCAFRAQERSD